MHNELCCCAPKQLEGQQKKDSWNYMANTYRSEDMMQNFQAYCMHSQLETRLTVPEPGSVKSLLMKGMY